MPGDIEILLPVRNPPDELRATISSLLAQTDRDFSVLISDNHSTTRSDVLGDAVLQLTAARIRVRVVQPPESLQSVELLNWLHFASMATWLKPLFAGDSLMPEYIASVRASFSRESATRCVYSGYYLDRESEGTVEQVNGPWSGGFRAAEELRDRVLSYELRFGPPSAAVYLRDAFIAVGGYHTGLPGLGGALLASSLATRFGAFALPQPLVHARSLPEDALQSHPAPRVARQNEMLTCLLAQQYHAWTEGHGIGMPRWRRTIWRALQSYFWNQ